MKKKSSSLVEPAVPDVEPAGNREAVLETIAADLGISPTHVSLPKTIGTVTDFEVDESLYPKPPPRFGFTQLHVENSTTINQQARQEFTCLHEPINIPPWPPILTAQQFPQTEFDKWSPYIMSDPAQDAPKSQP